MNSSPSIPTYELAALRYATSPKRRPKDNFIFAHDLHDGPMPLDFFVWAAISADRVVLIDSGSDEGVCNRRGHQFLRCPSAILADMGIPTSRVTDVVVTHAHWDHMGNLDKFPQSTFHIHNQEMAHATGCAMCYPALRRPYDVDQVCDVVRALYGGRVSFSGAEKEIAPGISVHHVGGHTPGLQVVRVNTKRGKVVLASDAMHLYANAKLGNPFPVLVDVQAYLQAFDRIAKLADSADHIIAGHDPVVLQIYPAWSDDMSGQAVRLDVAPIRSPESILPQPQ